MKQRLLLLLLSLTLAPTFANGHCQMPCGIYHDDMVYDQIDQYVETMIKAISILTKNDFSTVGASNTFTRWVLEKEKASDEAAHTITTYFLQQKIKPDEVDTSKRLICAHRLLFLLVAIKQTVDLKIVDEFADEWETFKEMFHVKGYECKMEILKEKKKLKASELYKELDKHKHSEEVHKKSKNH